MSLVQVLYTGVRYQDSAGTETQNGLVMLLLKYSTGDTQYKELVRQLVAREAAKEKLSDTIAKCTVHAFCIHIN
jgi:hypothetical protein